MTVNLTQGNRSEGVGFAQCEWKLTALQHCTCYYSCSGKVTVPIAKPVFASHFCFRHI